jgi:hypothetical protein
MWAAKSQLIYNSTLVTIQNVVRLPPYSLVEEERRFIFLAEPICAVLRDRPTTIKVDFPNPKAEVLITAYIAGNYITVSMLGDPSGAGPDLERMHTVDEVWLFCFRSVKNNQWRIMGRFVAPNTFVGLRLYRRSELDGDNYERCAFEFQVCWQSCFGARPFIRSSLWTDYLSGYVKNVDQPDPF